MISLRSLTSAAVAAIAIFAVACSDGPVQPTSSGVRQPSGANFDGKVGDVGNAAKNGDIDVRVLLDKSGLALLQIRTGSYNPTTGVAVPNGYFQSLQYKIYDAAGKQVAVRNVKFTRDGVSLYSTYLDLCSSSADDEADEQADNATRARTCSTKYGINWSVSVQANLKAVGGDANKTDVVREDGKDGYLPDIDILTQPVSIVGSNGAKTPIPSTGAGIPAAAPVSYSVSIPNDKVINGLANTLGAMVTCVVSVDNIPQLAVPNVPVGGIYPNPNLFSYGVGGATQPIPAGATATCNFSLSLAAGAHTIAVSALVLTPGDYDLSNNTTAKFKVTASSGPPDVATLGGLKKLSSGVYSDLGSLSLSGGASTVTTTMYQQVEQKSLTTPGSVTCKFAVDGTEIGVSTPVTPALNGITSTGYCSLPVPLTVGSHTVTVTTVTADDNNSSNNSSSTTIVVAAGPVTGTLSASLFLTNGGKVALTSNPVDVMSGSTNNYSAEVSLASLANTPGPIPVTCSVLVDNMVLIPGTTASIGSSTVLLTWIGGTGTISVANNATVPCNFTLKMTESGNADVPHTIVVTASTNATTTPTTVSTANGVVRDLVRVDLSGVGMFQLNGTALSPLVTVPMNTPVTLAMVFHNPDATRSVTFNCAVTGTGTVNTSYAPIQLTNITAGPNGDAYCQWSVKPATLQALQFAVVATAVAGSPVDPNLTNNTANGVLVVKSDGKFSTFDASNTYVRQEWFNAFNTADYPISKLTLQIARVNQLALLVIPTNDGNLGHFELFGQAVNGTTAFPIGEVEGPLTASGSEPVCGIIGGAGPRSTFPTTPGLPSQFGYSASICSQATTLNGQPGYQQITVNYTQSIETAEMHNPVVNPGQWAFTPGVVDMRIKLRFTLPGGQPDSVSGTIRIPTGSSRNTFLTEPSLFGTDEMHSFFDPYGTLKACIVGNPGC